LADNVHLTIEEVAADGEPLLPRENVKSFVSQCGFVVRDNVPITIRDWHKPAKEDGVSFLDDRVKDGLWASVIAHFSLPVLESDELTQKMRANVKEWALKKMATQFQSFKKKLNSDYVKKNKTPEFTGPLEKQKQHWDAFVKYKKSDEATQRSAKNKENADKKKYFHKLGTGGYKSAMPKWDKAESDMLDHGITPETLNWPVRSRNWLLGHGASYNPQTGEIIHGKKSKVVEPHKKLVDAIKEVEEGTFRPDRERDELWKALGNDEHFGRTRGFGASVPWRKGFANDLASYKSRERAKKRKKAEEGDRMAMLEVQVKRLQEQQDKMREQRETDPAFDGTGGPSQREQRETEQAASTGVPADDAPTMDAARMIDAAPMDRYPVDAIKEKTSCELHVSLRNISMKVAVGYALPCTPGATYHCSPIPAGYARVGVDEVQPEFRSLELDMPGGEGETTLGEVTSGFILWNKKHIVFPGSAPRPSSPPSSHPPPPSPPPAPRDPSASPPPSPPPAPREPSASPPPAPRDPSASPPPAPRDPSASPSPAQAHQPTPPTKSEGRKRKSTTAPSRKTAAGRTTKKAKEAPKLAYHMTDEETTAFVAAEVKEHFAPKQPQPKEKVHPKVVEHFVGLLERPPAHVADRDSDYDRSIKKSYIEQKRRTKGARGKQVPQLGEQKRSTKGARGKQVPQLGEQEKQSIDPLYVLPYEEETVREIAANLHMTVAELLSGKEIPKADLAWTYRYGQPMVRPEQVQHLPTQMRRLHEWYMQQTKEGRKMLLVKVKREHYFRDGEIHIELEELFQLFNQDALDKSIVTCYCL
jgi:hypothetical protein